MQTLESSLELAREMMQLWAFFMKRRLEDKPSFEAKREALTTMKKTECLENTLGILRELHCDLKEVGELEFEGDARVVEGLREIDW